MSELSRNTINKIEAEIYNFQMWESIILTSFYYAEPEIMAFVWYDCEPQNVSIACVWKLWIYRSSMRFWYII